MIQVRRGTLGGSLDYRDGAGGYITVPISHEAALSQTKAKKKAGQELAYPADEKVIRDGGG